MLFLPGEESERDKSQEIYSLTYDYYVSRYDIQQEYNHRMKELEESFQRELLDITLNYG
jgi:hypothetical protein